MCLSQRPQRSDAGEALTHGASVLSQALYHWATVLHVWWDMIFFIHIDVVFLINIDGLN